MTKESFGTDVVKLLSRSKKRLCLRDIDTILEVIWDEYGAAIIGQSAMIQQFKDLGLDPKKEMKKIANQSDNFC